MARGASLCLVVLLGGCPASNEPPVLPGERDPPCELSVVQSYLIDRLEVPLYGSWPHLDLSVPADGQSDVGNHLHDTLVDGTGTMVIDALERALAIRRLIWVINVSRCSGKSHARVSLRRGVSVDGNGVVVVAPDNGVPAVGTWSNGMLNVAAGVAEVPVAVGFDAEADLFPPTWIASYQVTLAVTDQTSALEGVIGYATPIEDSNLPVATALARTLTIAAAADPDCPDACDRPVLGALIQSFDLNDDRSFDAQEIIESHYMGFFGQIPVLDLLVRDEISGEWLYWPSRDLLDESDGASFRFSASPVEIVEA